MTGPWSFQSDLLKNSCVLRDLAEGTRSSDPQSIIEDRDGFMVEKGARGPLARTVWSQRVLIRFGVRLEVFGVL